MNYQRLLVLMAEHSEWENLHLIYKSLATVNCGLVVPYSTVLLESLTHKTDDSHTLLKDEARGISKHYSR